MDLEYQRDFVNDKMFVWKSCQETNVIHLQEPFCPPKPGMPGASVAPSSYLEDLIKLFEVSQQK